MNLKYLVILEKLVVSCDTKEQQIDATRRAIFGDSDMAGHEDEWRGILAKLEEDGCAEFEGDPPIYWDFTEIVPFDWYTRALAESVNAG